MYDVASELYNVFEEIYFDEYYDLSDAKKKKRNYHKYEPEKLFLKAYNYNLWHENEETTDKEDSTDKEEPTDKEDLLIKKNL